MNITVGTNSLRAALAATVPHVEPSPDIPDRHRVRLEIGGDDVTVSATNGYTAGVAIASIWEHHDGEPGAFDFSPNDVKEVLALFPGTREQEGNACLRIEVTDKHAIITDVSGLFMGKQLRLPRYPTTEKFPHIQQLIRDTIIRSRRSTERLYTTPDSLALFVKSAKAYGEPLVIDPAGRHGSLLITCGRFFIGLLAARMPDDQTEKQLHRWHMSWLDRINETGPPPPLIDFDPDAVQPQPLEDGEAPVVEGDEEAGR